MVATTTATRAAIATIFAITDGLVDVLLKPGLKSSLVLKELLRLKIMGKGGKSVGEEQNMAAWLVSINTLKIQPFNLLLLLGHMMLEVDTPSIIVRVKRLLEAMTEFGYFCD
ncbi:hypothetical protein Tco_0074046 [Tanacetum coccineum]